MPMNQTIPVQQISPLPPKVTIPKESKPPKPKANPKGPNWKGRKIWAEKVDGEWLMEEIFRRLQISIAETLSGLEDELSDDTDEPEEMQSKTLCVEPEQEIKALSFRQRILRRAALLRNAQR